MKLRHACATILAGTVAVLPATSSAQTPESLTLEQAAAKLAALQAQLEAVQAEVAALRAQQAAQNAQAAPVAQNGPIAAPQPLPVQQAAASPPPNPVKISWKGAPEISQGGWSFKPRGRIQIDGGYLDAPASRSGGQADGRGFTSRVRRAYLGAQGTIPGGFSYRGEVDFANGSATWTDLYLAYDNGPFNVTIGQHHPFTSLEQVQSDLFLSFNERAAFIGAFNLERRVGISVGYESGAFMVNAGVFTDDFRSLGDDGNKSVSYDGRVVWAPQFGDTQLHVGGSAHYRELGDFQAALGSQYRQRPYINTTDIRYVNTGVLTVDRETHYGAELALKRRRLHLVGEAAWLKADRPGGTDPTFFGGYAEAGLFLTDDTRGYKGGTFDRTVPTSPLGDGGFGAIELNIRYDHLDLTDAGINGGIQDGYGASIIWTPISYVRFTAGYMHLVYDIRNAPPSFSADSIGLRAQIDF